MMRIAQVSLNNLEQIYLSEFPLSKEYKELVLRLHDNVIEFNCL